MKIYGLEITGSCRIGELTIKSAVLNELRRQGVIAAGEDIPTGTSIESAMSENGRFANIQIRVPEESDRIESFEKLIGGLDLGPDCPRLKL